MALQGDLSSFALPEVLRLLAGTAKSGRLEVHGPGTSGELGLLGGGIAHGELHGAARSSEPGEVLFELLRLDGGSFAFDEDRQPADGPTTDVEFALERAEALVREWAEVEEVVPSMEAWVALVGTDRDDELHLSALQWRTIVAIGGGGTVRDLATALDLGDLDACRAVATLADADLIDIRVSHAAITSSPDEVGLRAEPFELDDFDQFEVDPEPMGMTGLEDLVVEDRPVVMEDSEDALLPEPLPGEGVAYEGEAITGSVDGRTFDVAEQPVPEIADQLDDLDEHPDLQGSAEAHLEATAVVEAHAAGEPELDDERGSLLKFLSTVKP
ncbi:MAG: DUF4388 domain-containing protein [Acidimicrobiales bacterium]|nr:DUF4388 domain-containing protein [Acidimicrobiales bacterium]